MMSTRYSAALAILTLLALVPVGIHEYAGAVVDDCANAVEFFPESPADASDERGLFLAKRFRATGWREGEVAGDTRFRYTYLRTYDAKRAYYRPEQSLIEEAKPIRRGIDWVDSNGRRLPVHRAEYPVLADEIVQRIAGYVLVYEGAPVSNPYLAQLFSAPLRLVSGRAPMTLLFVHGYVPIDDTAEAETRLREHLRAAFATYERACRAG